LLTLRSTSKLEDHTFSAVRDGSFNILAATLYIWRPSFLSTTEGRVVLTDTNITWQVALTFHEIVYQQQWRMFQCRSRVTEPYMNELSISLRSSLLFTMSRYLSMLLVPKSGVLRLA